MAGRPKRRAKMMRRMHGSHDASRDRDWPYHTGNPRTSDPDGKRHAKAARKGWKDSAKSGWKPKRRKARKKSRDWRGHRKEHAHAVALGWAKHAPFGWSPKRRTYTGPEEAKKRLAAKARKKTLMAKKAAAHRKAKKVAASRKKARLLRQLAHHEAKLVSRPRKLKAAKRKK